MNIVDRLKAQLYGPCMERELEAAAEIERLQADAATTKKLLDDTLRSAGRLGSIVDLLKKTKDGVPVVPHYTTRLFYVHPGSGETYERTYEADLDDARSHLGKHGNVVWVSVEDCYSTKEAADAARNQP